MEKEFRINEIAKLLSTSADALRLYEKKKIIQPARDEDNSYRSYTQEDITRLYDLKFLQNMGFSLAEIVYIVTDATEEETTRLMLKRRADFQDKIRRYQNAVDQLDRVVRGDETVERVAGRHYIVDGPQMLVATYSRGGELDKRILTHPYFQKVMEYHTLFRRCLIIPRHYAHSDEMRRFGWPGYSIGVDTARELGIQEDDIVKARGSKRCVYTALRAENGLTREALAPTNAWMAQHGFEVKDDIIAWALKFSYDVGKVSRMYELWIPIED